ncbi:MAG: hypothetical protein F6K19_07800 [Cyanothece sp. SIO1E1]|nr:hypothetical protein [Cyanothece sp. SIO1E1]
MRNLKSTTTSSCRHCGYYTPEGRRGGQCGQLGVPVQGDWEACCLVIPPFEPAWKSLRKIKVWQQDMLQLPDQLSLNCQTGSAQIEAIEKANFKPLTTSQLS